MEKYGLGIAFSGGGAKGAAHCGALQALDEFGIKADAVAGTSAGSIAATLYAAGIRPIDMANMFATMDFRDLLGTQKPKGGLFDSKPLVAHLAKIIPFKNLEDLPLPATVVATSIERGCAQFFTEGEIAPRVAASCSIPIIFEPLKIGSEHYVDGGALMNLPVSALRGSCRKVIALNLHHAETVPYKARLSAIAMRSFNLMFLSNAMSEAKRADLLINIDTSAFSAYDLSKVETLFHIGYDTTVATLEREGYTRLRPADKLEFAHKAPKKAKIEDFKVRAAELRRKSEELELSAKELLERHNPHKKHLS